MNKINTTKKRAYILLSGIALLGIMSVICIAVIFYSEQNDVSDKYAMIYQDGNLLYSINLNDVESPYEITITGDDDAYNTILVENGKISMSKASCPDKICVNTGSVTSSFLPIVCLPNKVVIQIKETSSSGNTIDAVTD